MPLIETEEAARRLARAIASDLSLYNEDKIVSGIKNDNLFESLAEEIEEGRALYKRRVVARALPAELLRPRARRHPDQGQGAHQIEALVSGRRAGRRRAIGARRPARGRRARASIAFRRRVGRVEAVVARRAPALDRARPGDGRRARREGGATSCARASAIVVEPEPPRVDRGRADAACAFDVLHVDDDVVVVNKPAGLVVHPARGHESGTLVNGLLARGLFDARQLGRRTDDGRSRARAAGDRASPRQGDERRHGRRAHARARASAEGAVPGAHDRARVRGDLRRATSTTQTFATLHGRHPTDRLRFTTRVTRGKRAVTHVRVLERLARRARTSRAARDRAHPPDPRPPRRGGHAGPRRPALRQARRSDPVASRRWPRRSGTRRCTRACSASCTREPANELRFEVAAARRLRGGAARSLRAIARAGRSSAPRRVRRGALVREQAGCRRFSARERDEADEHREPERREAHQDHRGGAGARRDVAELHASAPGATLSVTPRPPGTGTSAPASVLVA